MAFDAFLKLDDVKGEAVDSKHKDEIEVLGFRWSGNKSEHSLNRGEASRAVQFARLTIVKKVDRATPLFIQAMSENRSFRKGKLTLRKAGNRATGQSQVEYMVFDFEEVGVSVYRTGATTSDRDDIPTEEVELTYGKFLMTYLQQGGDGQAATGAVEYEYDLRGGGSS